MNISKLLSILVKVLFGTFSFIGILIFIFYNLEQFEILLGWICRSFSWVNRKFKLNAISTSLQGKINRTIEKIESEVEGVMPNPIKILWASDHQESANLEEGEIIVKISDKFDDPVNMVKAILLYLKAGFLRQSRPYTNSNIQEALDLDIAWKLLDTNEESNSGSYFLNEIFKPAILDNEEIGNFLGIIRKIDIGGMLTRIYLRELRGLGRKVTKELPKKETFDETKNFLNFIYTIYSSERGAKYPLNFHGKKIKAGVILVANNETFINSGLQHHKKWLKRKSEMGLETIYVLAMGEENINLARILAQWGQNNQLVSIVKNHTFLSPTHSGKPMKAIIVSCHSRFSEKDSVLSQDEKVQATLISNYREFASGEIEIMDIAIEPDYQIKVIIKSTTESIYDPVKYLAVKHKMTFNKLCDEFKEHIRLIELNEDNETFLLDCLGIRKEEVVSLDLSIKREEANIVVVSSISAASAIGSQGKNLKLTKQITGLKNINIRCQHEIYSDSEGKSQSPESELLEELKTLIPEISSKQIDVVKIVRYPGKQSKIVVRSNQENINPIKTCIGEKNRNQSALGTIFPNEKFHFVRWEEDIKDFLINCLGISNFRVDDVNIVENEEKLIKATVVVNTTFSKRKCIGVHGINVKLAAYLTGISHIHIMTKDEKEKKN